MFHRLFASLTLAGIILVNTFWPAQRPAADLEVYADGLASGWESWSWDVSLNLADTAQVHSGSQSLSAQYTAAWGGVSLRTPAPLVGGDYTALDFWAYGGAGGTQISVSIQSTDGGTAPAAKDLTLPAGSWTHFSLPLTELGSPAGIARLNWQDRSGATQARFYLDDIRLVSSGASTGDLTLLVDTAANRHAINPYIYGMNLGDMEGKDAAEMAALGVTVRRWGGNATSRYNYQTDISNHAMDWYFGNVKESSATNLPGNSAINRFIAANRQVGVQNFIVMPTTGYVANNNGTACGFSIKKYGPQTGSAAGDYRPDCGNGIKTDGSYVTGNNPLDTSIAAPPTFVANWVQYLVGRNGPADEGGIRFYNLDNEPDLWWETHRDVAPTGLTYDQLGERAIQYAAAIKSADPSALVAGPALGVWTYYFYSPFDGQRQDWATPDDRLAHDDMPFTPWYLQQLHTYEHQQGKRLLDYLDLHYYPQASGVALSGAGSAAQQALRLRSTRSLWDPTYVDESWIAQAGPDNGIVQLIPRMKAWVDVYYPNTKLAIGEYNWGALDHINGALAQADVLGIFGQEGLDLATLWAPPAPSDPGAFAFRMYRNYDGLGGQFGDVSLRAASSDRSQLAIYAAQRSGDQAVTVMVINKTGGSLNATLALSGFTPRASAQVYRYSPANLSAIQHPTGLPTDTGSLSASFPANSITLLVIPASEPGNWQSRLYLPIARQKK